MLLIDLRRWIVIPAIICLANACNKKVNPVYSLDGMPYLLAWNEDTILSYQVALFRSGRFAYTIGQRNGRGEVDKAYYSGHFRNTADTVYLHFKHNSGPRRSADYLVREMSGRYLIQFFLDGRKRVFLRIERKPMR